MVVYENFFGFVLFFECHHFPDNHNIPTSRKYHYNPYPKKEGRPDKNSYRCRNDTENNTRHQCAQDVVLFWEWCRTCAIWGEKFFHESKLDVLEMMLGIHTFCSRFGRVFHGSLQKRSIVFALLHLVFCSFLLSWIVLLPLLLFPLPSVHKAHTLCGQSPFLWRRFETSKIRKSCFPREVFVSKRQNQSPFQNPSNPYI